MDYAMSVITLSGYAIRIYRLWFLYFSAKEKLAVRQHTCTYVRKSPTHRRTCTRTDVAYLAQKEVSETRAVPRDDREIGSPLKSSSSANAEDVVIGCRSTNEEVNFAAQSTTHTKTELTASVPNTALANSDQINRELHSSESTKISTESDDGPDWESSSASASLTPWFFRRRHFGSDKFLLRLLFGIAGTQILALSLSFLLINYITGSDEQSDDCLSLNVSFYYLAVSASVFIVSLAVTAWKIRRINDGFFIKTELKVILFLMVVIIGVTRIPDEWHTMIQWIPTQVGIIISLYWPAHIAHKQNQKRERRNERAWNSKSSHASLLEVLVSESRREQRLSFRNHLVAEFSIENILFWDAAREFADAQPLMDDVECALAALKLYQEFIAMEAIYQVNLPSDVSAQIEGALETAVVNFDCFRDKDNLLDPSARRNKTPEDTMFTQPGATNSELYGNLIWRTKNESKIKTKNASLVDPQAHRSSEKSHASHEDSSGCAGARDPVLRERPASEIFQRAQKIIFELMERDPYLRWKTNQKRSSQSATNSRGNLRRLLRFRRSASSRSNASRHTSPV